MRPVYLSLSGLQSYREKQEVDFTRLCDAGVFGIFGPTGSGKSTILDAITLALYGKVERASNGTQGILNHAEKVLSVSFVFELSYSGGVKKYRVERQFKRGNELSVNNTISRLIEEANGEGVVLADKASEVNQRIQQILGLSMQDFTRAVVLPQGKFAEFLSLKGSERRQMLQRLFHLEQYGDLLNARVSRKLKDTEAAVKELAAEQQGLGDASREAVAAAEQRFQSAAEQAKEKRELRLLADMRWEESRKIYMLKQEAAALRQEWQALAGREPEIRAMEEGIQRAGQAELLYPLFREWEEARRWSAEKLRLHNEIKSGFERMSRMHDETAAQYTEARQRLAEHEAPLRIRMEELQQALRLAEEAGRSEAALHALDSRKQEALLHKQKTEEELLKERQIHAKALRLQTELKERKQLVEVPSEERQRLQDASKAQQKWETLARQRAEGEREAQEAEERLALVEKEEREVRSGQERLANRLQLHWSETVRQAASAAQLERSAAALLREANDWLRRIEEEEREQELGRLASMLASSLSPGDACPVCGSLHHPAPAQAHTAHEYAGEIKVLKQVAEEAKDLQVQAMQLKLSVGHLAEKLADRIGGASLQEAAAAAAEAATPPEGGASMAARYAESAEAFIGQTAKDGKESVPGPNVSGDEAEQVHLHKLAKVEEQADKLLEHGRALRERLEGEKNALARMEGQMRDLFAEWTLLEQRRGELAARKDALRTVKDGGVRKLEAVRAEMDLQEREWQRRFPDLNRDTLEEQLAALHHKDKEREELNERLDKSVVFLENSLAKLNELQAEMVERDKELLQLDTERKGLEQLLSMQKQQLAEKAGHEPVDRQLSEVKSRLERLVAEEKEQAARLEKVRAELQELNRQFIASGQDCSAADQQLAKTEAHWRKALEPSPFAGEEEVRRALLTPERLQQWSSEVAEYRDRKSRLEARLEHIDGQLSGADITEAQWQEIQRAKEEAHLLDEQALSERAKAERDLEDLKNKHAHWTELEAKRARNEEEYGRLHKLQSVLRGNAFVEFIAEEQLMQVSRSASHKLGQLTRQRYAIEIDSSGGFVIRDDANGGIRRPVSSLSGGETFLTSLALALALSAQIQLSGQYPLEFFFLDEGFGTLDPDLLDTVIGALEKLHTDRLTVGIISHVPELKARLPRRLIVQPAEPSGQGSRLYVESL
ncbi:MULTISPECIES: AAA family ATPase [Paenibacillus]|uniref:Nuclease SbcCD subunit C n=1 Tax=Paenibacillus residui TaxID=629724 RepID=A0ABW3DC59_9BACL